MKSRKRPEKSRKRLRPDSDDEDESKFSKTAKLSKVISSPKSLSEVTLPKLTNKDELRLQNFKRSFWTGPSAESVDEEEMKHLRKSIGVLVKGSNLTNCPPPIESIDSVGLPIEFNQLFRAVSLTVPTSVQKQCWPALLSGNNVLAISPTGSGKTLGYSLPAIPHIKHRLLSSSCRLYDKPAPIALILVPTRELAVQVSTALKPLKRLVNISTIAIYGGEDKEKQIDHLSEGSGHAIVVATPGRLVDLLHSKKITLANVSYLVIDEADRMLAMGFREQISLISTQIVSSRQSTLFSATFPGKLRELCDEWVPSSIFIRCNTIDMKSIDSNDGNRQDKLAVSKETKDEHDEHLNDEHEDKDVTNSSGKVSSFTISSSVEQLVHVCSTHKKPRLLIRYILKVREDEKNAKMRQPGLMLIFCTKIKTLKFVADFLKRQDQTNFCMLHGQLPQSQREKSLMDFKSGKVPILISTDVAARGIHIKRLKYVINYDFPSNLEQYCHRVGRTGRQGESGFAYSLFTRTLAPLAKDLITLLQSCSQTPEPNLISLCDEYNSGSIPMSECELEDDSNEN